MAGLIARDAYCGEVEQTLDSAGKISGDGALLIAEKVKNINAVSRYACHRIPKYRP